MQLVEPGLEQRGLFRLHVARAVRQAEREPVQVVVRRRRRRSAAAAADSMRHPASGKPRIGRRTGPAAGTPSQAA